VNRRTFATLALAGVLQTALPRAQGDPMNDAASAVAPSDLTLWYDRPAKEWTEALPLGNGRLGAMVFGRVGEERLQLNEDTLWAASPTTRPTPKRSPPCRAYANSSSPASTRRRRTWPAKR
jgi:alpha-L-fucosidase 2